MKPLTLDFGSGHDLTVQEMEPCVRLWADSAEPAWDSFFLSLCPSSAHSLTLKNKLKKLKNKLIIRKFVFRGRLTGSFGGAHNS